MPDYDALLSQQRNELLGSQQPTTREAIRAGIQSTTGTPYAQNRSNILAERYNRALGGYQVLSNERDFQTRQDQQMWLRAQAEAERGDENFKRLLDLSGAYGANEADSQRLAAWAIQQAEERNVDDPNMVPSLVAEGAEALGLPARPELTLMSTAGGGVTGIDPLGGTRTIVEGETAAPKPYTDIGKVNADLTAGLITPAQALQAASNLSAKSAAEPLVEVVNPDGSKTYVPRSEAAGRTSELPEQPTARTNIGKINRDLANGVITPTQALRAIQDLYADIGETWRPMTAEERTQYSVPEGRAAQISSKGKASVIGSSGGISIYDPETGNIIAQVGGTPLTESQVGKQGIEISDRIRESNARLSELSSALRGIQENPEATGLRGVGIEKVGGVLEDIANMVGVDQEWLPTAEVQSVRTELASLLGQYIPTITGDDSGRYSDQDMRRANLAFPATRAGASFQQVQASLLTLRDVEERSLARSRMRLDGFGPEVDITYRDGRESYAVSLFREGKTPEEAAQIIQELMDKYEISPSLEGIR